MHDHILHPWPHLEVFTRFPHLEKQEILDWDFSLHSSAYDESLSIFHNFCLILWLPVFHVLCQCFSSVALCSSELSVRQGTAANLMSIFHNSCQILWLLVFHVLCQCSCFSSVALCSSELPVWRRIWRLEGTWTSSASNTHAAIYFTAKIIKTYIIVGIKIFKNGLLIGT